MSVKDDWTEHLWEVQAGTFVTPAREGHSTSEEMLQSNDPERAAAKGYQTMATYSLLVVNREGVRYLRVTNRKDLVLALKMGRSEQDALSNKTTLVEKDAFVKSAQVPYIRARYSLQFEKVRVLWFHGGKAVVAMQLDRLIVRGLSRPKSVPAWVFKSTRPAAQIAENSALAVSLHDLMSHALSKDSTLEELYRVQEKHARDIWRRLNFDGSATTHVTVGSLHIDHYIEGAIPVILRSTASMPEAEKRENERRRREFQGENVTLGHRTGSKWLCGTNRRKSLKK